MNVPTYPSLYQINTRVWMTEFARKLGHPDYFIAGTAEALRREPQNYTRLKGSSGDRILAYGRDPYFSGWPDTLQLNYGAPATQEAVIVLRPPSVLRPRRPKVAAA